MIYEKEGGREGGEKNYIQKIRSSFLHVVVELYFVFSRQRGARVLCK